MVYESTKCYQSAGPSATALFSRTVRTILLRKVLVRKERGTTGGSVKNWGGGMDPADQAPGTLERWTSAVACEIPLDLVHIVVQQTEK